MKVSKIELVGEICDCKDCRTGINAGCICSNHRGKERVSFRIYVDRNNLERPVEKMHLDPGSYKITIEKIEENNGSLGMY